MHNNPYNYNPTSIDPTYLNMFYDDCIKAQDSYNNHNDMGYYNEDYNVNYENIDNFLIANNMQGFNEFGESFCVNDCHINEERRSKPIIPFLISTLAWIIIICISLVLKGIDIFVTESIAIVLFPIISFFIITMLIVPQIQKYHLCNYPITAICVDVLSKISYDSDGQPTTLYQPFYYIIYNSMGYVLFSNQWSNICVPSIGEPINNFYINPDNPFEYRTPSALAHIILFSTIAIIFLLIGVFMLIEMSDGNLYN